MVKECENLKYPLVSAVITTHNRCQLVREAIQSVQNQTYPNIEIIVVDDASSDGTRDVLTPMAKAQGFRYMYVSQNKSGGGNRARNIGIRASKGIYVAFLDDDDEWMPEKIEKQIAMLKTRRDSQLCYCGRINDYNYGEKQKENDTSLLQEGDLSKEIFIKWQCFTSEMIVERKLLIKAGLFDESLQFWQDYELCMRLFQMTKICTVRENLIIYRIIQTDKQRLTNKIDGWEDAVDYIYKKHKSEMELLSLEDCKRRDYFWLRDGAERCEACGDKRRERCYLWNVYRTTHAPKDALRAILNVCSLKKMIKGAS